MSDSKVALITGAARRLGKALAFAFADNGFDVIVHYNTSEAEARMVVSEIEMKGKRSIAIQADISDIRGIKNFYEKVNRWTSTLDVLVNNAGIFPTKKFTEVDEALWDETLNTNLRSMFFITQSLLPLMKCTKRASIINIASLGAFHPWNNHIPYCISKAGVVMLTRALAKTLAPDIRVNAVAPGVIVLPDEENKTRFSADKIPLKRYGTAKDFVDTVLFLALKADYITGQVISLDGGILQST